MAPEYAMHGYLTDKADVYSFGIVALEIINGRSNTIHRQKVESFSILEWAHLLKEKGDLMDLVDRRLGSNFNKEEVLVMIKVALLCTNVTAALRPTMSSVVSMLEGITVAEEVIPDTSEALDEKKLEAMRLYYRELGILKEEPWTASSTSKSRKINKQRKPSSLRKRLKILTKNSIFSYRNLLAMKDIARTLGWEFNGCSKNVTYTHGDETTDMVVCKCEIPNDSFCHVVKICVFYQPRLVERSFEVTKSSRQSPPTTDQITLSPRDVSYSSLLGNRLTGRIPKELGNLTNLTRLILEFNQLSGNLPPELGNLAHIEKLHLSSNNFTGQLPASLARLTTMQEFRISDNQFSGNIPDFIKNWTSLKQLKWFKWTDSLTNFTSKLIRLTSYSTPSTLPTHKGFTNVKSLHINCGGKQTTIGGITYDEDIDPAGPAAYKLSRNNWAFSNTGHFMDNDTFDEQQKLLPYITDNETRLYMTDVELYKNARISPMSLTYYGFCLENGDYTVKLHFAEIMFTDDNTYRSLGRRLFDVYIQGKRVLKDFNIVNEAQGVGKECIKQFPAHVSSNDLEIRLYWAGKGTTYMPYKSVNGPLISAISVEKELRDLDLQTSLFTLRQIKTATNNFDILNKIGEGGFGPVYKGILPNNTTIAVKQLSSTSAQGTREFINEIGMISALQHPNLVKLYGCCVEGDQLLLVYEYMKNNSLAHALFDKKYSHLKLNWQTRQKICVGIARGLTYLHEQSRLKVVHRDLKTSNVLLDEDLNPKISDFGLARLHEGDNTHISTRIAGTWGYMAPEYAMHGFLTHKADVYSFGVVILEILSGKRNTIQCTKEEVFYLLDWARLLKDKGKIIELVDPRLGSNFNEDEVMVMVKVALLCTNVSSNLRPAMSSVLSMLEGTIVIPEFIAHTSEVADEKIVHEVEASMWKGYLKGKIIPLDCLEKIGWVTTTIKPIVLLLQQEWSKDSWQNPKYVFHYQVEFGGHPTSS
ncbi:hypothetical protein Fmac_018890 [Flemingia macrophylla]|uniref:non-specific serine/threonine protein kinase n=1 Tax=Flemingia macrophylla TaxID=520843 RepID=A0ABD1M6B2_9FABA